MNRVRAFLILLGATALALPVSAYAADIPLLSPGWSLVPEACRSCPCGLPGVLAIVQNLVNAGIGVAIVFCVIIMAWAGILFMTTPTNPEARSKANHMLINAAIGLMIVLSAWLMVDFVMKILYNPNNAGWGPWNTILGDSAGTVCIEATETQKLFTGSLKEAVLPSAFQTSGADTVPGTYTPGGKCTVQTSGACAPSNLSVFGSAANEASQVCFGESSGWATAVSSTDKLADGTPYSIGLFQINLSSHNFGSLNCPTAFTKQNCTPASCGKGSGVKVQDVALYNKCVAAAKNAATNIAKAHEIYLQEHASWRKWGAAKECSLAK